MAPNGQRYGRVAVLMGGWSAERAISLRSGRAVCAALQRIGIDAETIDVGADILEVLAQRQFDRAFIALHGRGGEDGVIQGALEILGLPYTGSGVLASALAMDKFMTKRVWRAVGLPTPACRLITGASDPADVVAELGLPIFVKPCLEGSSLGSAKVTCIDELRPAWAAAAPFGPVLAEAFIRGTEYTIGILDNRTLPAIRLETPHRFYDYDAKYHANDTQYHCPAGLDDTAEQALAQLALTAFNALGATGWGRVDIICDQHRTAWLLEVNTVPGMTDHSLVPMAAQVAGLSFETLVRRILDVSFNRRGN